MKTEVVTNLKTIDAKITELCKVLNKERKDISVSLATKTQKIEDIELAMDTGIPVSCGENRMQELVAKYTPKYKWDFIGQLQTNKVKYIIDKVNLIQSLDRIELAKTIEKEAAKRDLKIGVLIEVNLGEEPQKGGVLLKDIDELLDFTSNCPHILLKGLMTVAPDVDDPAPYFKKLVELYNHYSKIYSGFEFISAGMSKDFLTAIKCGANLVRLGSVVFGAREPLYEKENT